MSFIAQLWIPILVSAVLIFVASSLIHMVFKWHNSEYRKLSNEEAVRATLRAGSLTPGQYAIPHCLDMKEMSSPEMTQKFVDGPIALITVRRSGPPKMGSALGLWFVYVLAICAIAAYVANKALPDGANFHMVGRLIGALSLLAFAGGSVQMGIWMGKPWSSVAKDVLDAIIYAVIAGAIFGWLWPR